MGRMSYEDAERLLRRVRSETTRRNVRAHRLRRAQAGMHRLDLCVTGDQFKALTAARVPGESYSATIGRAIDALTGNT